MNDRLIAKKTPFPPPPPKKKKTFLFRMFERVFDVSHFDH